MLLFTDNMKIKVRQITLFLCVTTLALTSCLKPVGHDEHDVAVYTGILAQLDGNGDLNNCGETREQLVRFGRKYQIPGEGPYYQVYDVQDPGECDSQGNFYISAMNAFLETRNLSKEEKQIYSSTRMKNNLRRK